MRELKVGHRITDRSEASMAKYLAEITKLKTLSAEEETALVVKYKKGCKESRDQLIKSNLRFVISVAKQYTGRGLPLNDLINEGNIGLIRAIDKFDETKGFKLISYAVWWIRQAILESLSESSRTIRLPNNKVLLYHKIESARNELYAKLGYEPQPDQLLEALNEGNPGKYKEGEIITAMTEGVTVVSIDNEIGNDDSSGESSFHDLHPSDDPSPDTDLLHHESLSLDVKKVLSNLSKENAYIIRALFGIGMAQVPHEELAENLGISHERLRQKKVKILKKLKEDSYADILVTYLG